MSYHGKVSYSECHIEGISHCTWKVTALWAQTDRNGAPSSALLEKVHFQTKRPYEAKIRIVVYICPYALSIVVQHHLTEYSGVGWYSDVFQSEVWFELHNAAFALVG